MDAVPSPVTTKSKRQPPSPRRDLGGCIAAVSAATAPPAKPAYVPADPLLKATEAAAEAGMSLSAFWRAVRDGRMPEAYYVTPRAPRWRRSEILAALEALRGAR